MKVSRRYCMTLLSTLGLSAAGVKVQTVRAQTQDKGSIVVYFSRNGNTKAIA